MISFIPPAIVGLGLYATGSVLSFLLIGLAFGLFTK